MHRWHISYLLPYGLNYEQIDLRKESTIKFIAAASFPVITFGPFASPTDVLVSLSHAIGIPLGTSLNIP